jgi:NADH-quinone oxidoreductase subunit C
MTVLLPPAELASRIREGLSVDIKAEQDCLRVQPENMLEVAAYLKDTPGLEFDYCDMLTAVDYPDRLEITYRLISLPHNRLTVLKVNLDRHEPVIPSLISLYRSAEFQEREIFDLFGVRFSGHPYLRRIMLWEGFEGHPLLKDYGRAA